MTDDRYSREPAQPAADGADAPEELREQLGSVSAGDLVAQAALSLLTLAYVRLGLPPEQHEKYRDLEAARLLVDALGGLLGAVQGRLGAVETELRDALAQVRMAYVSATEHAEPARHADADAAGAAAGARPEPEEPRIVQPPSGLWVPGMD